MQQISRIHHVGLRVSSLEVSRAFYAQLGFDFIAGPIGPEPAAIIEHPCGININLILNASAQAKAGNVLMDEEIKQTGYTHIALEVKDMDEVIRQLARSRITITERVEYEGARLIFIRDPDGNVIEFHQPAQEP